jgi:hypothetical protein
VRGYLRHLQKQGWRLPLDLTSDHDQLGDLAIDLLGPILASSEGKPCSCLVEFLKKHGCEDFSKVDPEELYGVFTARVFYLVHEELRGLRRDADPQVENLKRRFGDILAGPEYSSRQDRRSRITYIALAETPIEKQLETPEITYEELEKVVDAAYRDSNTTRSDWCRKVLETLAARDDVRSSVKKHELVKAAVSVNIRYLRDEAVLASGNSSPETEFAMVKAKEIRLQTLDWLKENVVQKFADKWRISEVAAVGFVKAANLYLQDFVYSAGNDKLPVYFRETMPEEEHRRYLQVYKHPFETTMKRAEEEFRSRLKNVL